jgi:hypothetical protein
MRRARADESERGLRPRAGDLECRRTVLAREGPWARNAPRHAASASHVAPETALRRQPADGPSAAVDEAGLARERLAVLDDADE